MKKYSFRKISWLIVGLIILAFGIFICKKSFLGMDTFTGMNTAISNYLDITLGDFQLILNIALFCFIFLINRRLIGLGSILNMVTIGYLVDFFSFILKDIFFSIDENTFFLIRFGVFLIGFILLCLGASLYMKVSLGVAPYDALAIIICDKLKKIPFKIARILTDVVCILVSVLFCGVLSHQPVGMIVGIGTICIGIATGPLIDFFNKYVSSVLIKNQ